VKLEFCRGPRLTRDRVAQVQRRARRLRKIHWTDDRWRFVIASSRSRVVFMRRRP
jgi:hypothetical protein